MFKNKIFNILKCGIYMHHFCWETTCPIILFWNKNKGDHYVLKFDITWDKEGIVWGLLFTINLIKILTLLQYLIYPMFNLDFIIIKNLIPYI
jgi:hypothetical protein